MRKSMRGEIYFYWILSIICFVFLNACASSTQFDSVWKDPAYQGGPLRKVLILGVAKKQQLRQYFEETFAQQMRTRGVAAVPSYTVFPESGIPPKEAIVTKINELKIDSVLITKFLDIKDVGTYEVAPTYVMRDGFYGYYAQSYHTESLGYEIVLATRIFDARSEKLIWSALSETILEGAGESVIDSFVPAIMQQLEDGQFIPKIKG